MFIDFPYLLLYSVYTRDGAELAKIPELYKVVQSYFRITKTNLVFVRCYSATGEVSYTEIFQSMKFLKIGVTKSYILPEPVEGKIQKPVIPEETPDLMSKKRAWHFKIISEVIPQVIETPIWVNYFSEGAIYVTQATSYGKGAKEILFDLFWTINVPEKHKSRIISKNYMTESTQRRFCEIMKDNTYHECKWCHTTVPTVPIIERDIILDDMDNLMVDPTSTNQARKGKEEIMVDPTTK